MSTIGREDLIIDMKNNCISAVKNRNINKVEQISEVLHLDFDGIWKSCFGSIRLDNLRDKNKRILIYPHYR